MGSSLLQKSFTTTRARCFCEPGYTGDGETCVEVDPCQQANRGGCHLQATCEKTSPGRNNCTCNSGWTGDGTYCYPATICRNHGDCHNQSDCIQTTPGQHVCRCRPGYHGDGLSCVLTNMCMQDNGGCDIKAICTPTGPGRVNCTCPVELGYSGSGYSCHGNLITQLRDHPSLQIIANVLKLDGGHLQQQLLMDANYTMFVPTDAAVLELVQKPSAEHWSKPEHMMTILNYQTLLNSSSTDTLVAMGTVYRKFETLADGFYLHFFREGETLTVATRETYGTVAKIIEKDIVATNGYLNVVDKVLEPYVPMSPDDYPDLGTLFNSTAADYSIFAGWLKDQGMITMLENDMNEYTLFVPNNAAARTINRTVTADFLKYYILPYRLMTASQDSGDFVTTLLGAGHRLVYSILGWNNVTINSVPIEAADMFTFGGIVNGISGLLHPVLNMCNEMIRSVEWGVCTNCGGPTVCPSGYESVVGARSVQRCMSTVKTGLVVLKRPGCQGLCVTQKTIQGCCAGYYGPHCAECPGGPEFPCNGVGRCSDRVNGTGLCTCRGNHTGPSCSQCTEGWTGTDCDVDMSGCGYKNGGCHFDGICSRSANGTISCECGDGYHGDGYNCNGPCEVNNGGCHRYAQCNYSHAIGTVCKCLPGFVGDGREHCNGDILATLATIPTASRFLKVMMKMSSEFAPPVNSTSPSQKYSLFVPVDSSLIGRVITMVTVRQHIVVGKSRVILLSTDHTARNYTTLSGDTIEIVSNAMRHEFYVNNTRVLEGNIECTNGIIHFLNASLVTLPPQVTAPPSTGVGVATIVVPVVLLLVVVVIVAVVIVTYKRSRAGYWDLLRVWISGKDSEGDQTARLHVGESRVSSGLPDNNTQFGNPLYMDDS